MPLATKNNAIILKDGKVAENCKCCDKCGSYYMRVTSVEVDITASDYVVSCNVNSPYGGVSGYGIPGSALNGTWSLNKTSETSSSVTWSSTFGLSISNTDYRMRVTFYSGLDGTDPVIMTGALYAPLLNAYKPQYNSSAFATFEELHAVAKSSAYVYSTGNALSFTQYCSGFNKSVLPSVTIGSAPQSSNINGIPRVDTSDAFERLIGTCNGTRVNAGSYRLGITALRVYV